MSKKEPSFVPIAMFMLGFALGALLGGFRAVRRDRAEITAYRNQIDTLRDQHFHRIDTAGLYRVGQRHLFCWTNDGSEGTCINWRSPP